MTDQGRDVEADGCDLDFTVEPTPDADLPLADDGSFWDKATTSGPCWPWRVRSKNGYGLAKVAGRTRLAHRVSWELTHGPVPKGLDLDHLCRNRACVRPSHLEPVTRAENVRRGIGPQVLSRKWAAMTTCACGHLLDEGNVYRSPAGRRMCRTCRRMAAAALYARKKAGA